MVDGSYDVVEAQRLTEGLHHQASSAPQKLKEAEWALVKHAARFALFQGVGSKRTPEATRTIYRMPEPFAGSLPHTVTSDNGNGFARHRWIPYRSDWQPRFISRALTAHGRAARTGIRTGCSGSISRTDGFPVRGPGGPVGSERLTSRGGWHLPRHRMPGAGPARTSPTIPPLDRPAATNAPAASPESAVTKISRFPRSPLAILQTRSHIATMKMISSMLRLGTETVNVRRQVRHEGENIFRLFRKLGRLKHRRVLIEISGYIVAAWDGTAAIPRYLETPVAWRLPRGSNRHLLWIH